MTIKGNERRRENMCVWTKGMKTGRGRNGKTERGNEKILVPKKSNSGLFRRARYVMVVLAGLMCMPGLVLARPAGSERNGKTESENTSTKQEAQDNKPHKLNPVTVTGTGLQRNLLDTPIPTFVVSGDAIEKKGAFSLYEALDGVPGVKVEQQCSYCNFSQVRIQGMASGNTKILINGLPLYTGLAGVYGLQQYLAANIDSIEIVKGAGSALYGGDAVAGVINVIAADPASRPSMSLSTSFETHDSGAFVFKGSKRTEDWAITGSVQRSYKGEIDENGDKLTDRASTDNFSGAATLFWYNPFDILDKITVFGSAINETRHGGNLEDNKWQNPFAESSERIQTKRLETGLSILKKFTRKFFVELGAAVSDHKRDATNDAANDDVFTLSGGSLTNASQLPMPFLADEKITFVHGKAVLEIGNHAFRNTFSAGVQLRHSDFEQEIGQLSQRAMTTKEADDLGIYLQDEISFNEVFEIVAGARFDLHNSSENYTNSVVAYEENQVSPRVALSWKPIEGMMLRSSVGTGFRVPYHFSEDLHLCSGSPKVYKGDDLKAEESLTVTGGVRYSFSEEAVLSVDYSMIQVQDKLDFVSDVTVPSGYDYAWKNLGEATSHGVDFIFTADVLPELNMELYASWIQSEYSDNPYAGSGFQNEAWGKNVLRVPSMSGGLSVNYSPGPVDIYASLKYTGEMYIAYDGEESGVQEIIKTPDFMTMDMRVAWSLGKTTTIFAGVKNLFDFVQEDKRPDDGAFIWGPYTGREIYGGATVKL